MNKNNEKEKQGRQTKHVVTGKTFPFYTHCSILYINLNVRPIQLVTFSHYFFQRENRLSTSPFDSRQQRTAASKCLCFSVPGLCSPSSCVPQGSSNQPHKLHLLQPAPPAWTPAPEGTRLPHNPFLNPWGMWDHPAASPTTILPAQPSHTFQGHTCIVNTQLIKNCRTIQHNVTKIVLMSVSTKLHLHHISKKLRNKANVSFLGFLRPTYTEHKQFWGLKKQ